MLAASDTMLYKRVRELERRIMDGTPSVLSVCGNELYMVTN
jgi:hypothetical protein